MLERKVSMRTQNALGVLVRAILYSRGKNIQWLAEESGVSESYWSLIFTDKRPLLPPLEEKLRTVLGLRQSVDLNEAARQLLEFLKGLEENEPP